MRFTFEVTVDHPDVNVSEADATSRFYATELRNKAASLIPTYGLSQVTEKGYRPSLPLAVPEQETPAKAWCSVCGKTIEPGIVHPCQPGLTEISPPPSSAMVKTPGADLEQGIEVDARFARMVEEMKRRPRYGRCATCQERIQISDDPVETHHIIMRHRAESCQARPAMKWTPEEYAAAVQDFEAQPHIVDLKRKLLQTAEAEQPARKRSLATLLLDAWENFRNGRKP